MLLNIVLFKIYYFCYFPQNVWLIFDVEYEVQPSFVCA